MHIISLNTFNTLPSEILKYIMSYVDYQTLLLIYSISHDFNDFYQLNLDSLLHDYLHKTTRLDTRRYNRTQLINLCKIPFKNNNISSGNNYSMILNNNGQVYAFGNNEYGQLGLGDNMNTNIPTLIPTFDNLIYSSAEKVINISCGEAHSLALTNFGQIYAFGINYHGGLGLNDNDPRNVPTPIPAINTDIISISCGNYHSLVLTAFGYVYSFGRNDYGQLGLGDNDNMNIPMIIDNLRDTIVQIAAGSYHSLLLTTLGQLYSFGQNINGELGLGDNDDKNIPVLVNTPMSSIIKISSKFFHSLILTNDGQVYAFGANYLRQLGLEDGINRHIPILVPFTKFSRVVKNDQNLNNIIQLSCGDSHSLVLMDNGQVYTFGKEKLDDMPNLSNIVQISAGGTHSLILISCGQVYSFGNNTNGQLGLGDNGNRDIPTMIMNI